MVFDFMDFDYIIKTVDDINSEISNSENFIGWFNNLYINLSGDYCSISISNTVLWDNYEDGREWLDDDNQESLIDCLTRRLDEYIESLTVTYKACLKLKDV